MAIGQVNPTRMELTKLKGQLATAKRGHKLLKDKQDEMIRQFMEMIRANRLLRIEIEAELIKIMKKFNNAEFKSSQASILEALFVPTGKVELKASSNYVMNLETPSLEYKASDRIDLTYSFFTAPLELDEAILTLAGLMPKIIELAELDKACSMLAREIEKTRRRVNAIEFVMMPEMTEKIHMIRMKLEDAERSNIVRLMKSKEIILESEKAKKKVG